MVTSIFSTLFTVYNYNGEYDNIPLGRVYCEDEDDWDLPDKTFEFFPEAPAGFTYVDHPIMLTTVSYILSP